MDAWTELARATTAAGDELVLRQRAGSIEIRCNGWDLMSNRAHHSETQLAVLACECLTAETPRVLIGGLGMGYTLRAMLDALPPPARVVVAELLPDIIAWNRGVLGPLARHPLRDERVTTACADVADVLAAVAERSFDAVVLDVDNGPDAVMLRGNAPLYTREGLQCIRRALTRGGVLAVWSADPSPQFERNLRDAGFPWQCREVPARGAAHDPVHTIYLARPRPP